MLQLLVDVVWPSGRVVHVRLRGIPEIADRGPRDVEDPFAIQRPDVVSLASFLDFIRVRTRVLPNGATVDCFGKKADVEQVFTLLDLEGQPPSYVLTLPEK